MTTQTSFHYSGTLTSPFTSSLSWALDKRAPLFWDHTVLTLRAILKTRVSVHHWSHALTSKPCEDLRAGAVDVDSNRAASSAGTKAWVMDLAAKPLLPSATAPIASHAADVEAAVELWGCSQSHRHLLILQQYLQQHAARKAWERYRAQ